MPPCCPAPPGGPPLPSRKRSSTPWLVTGVAAVLIAVLLLLGRREAVPQHPEPRADAAGLAETVSPASFYRADPRALQAYTVAGQIPTVLDGIYCYCRCKENFEHRSLLSCFQTGHGAACDICMREVETAYQMVTQGRSLDDVRGAVDLAFAGVGR